MVCSYDINDRNDQRVGEAAAYVVNVVLVVKEKAEMDYVALALQVEPVSQSDGEDRRERIIAVWDFRRHEYRHGDGRTQAWMIGRRLDKPGYKAWPIKGDEGSGNH